MPDSLTPAQRSKCMRRIRSKDTSIEVTLRKLLWHAGYRYRKNDADLPGKPDIALTKHKIAIFCDGEFFHGKEWATLEERLWRGKNSGFWVGKILKNMERDDEVNKQLWFLGWTVIRFWGEDIKNNIDECILAIEEAIFDNKQSSFDLE